MFPPQNNDLSALLSLSRPTAFQRCLSSPCLFLAKMLSAEIEPQPINPISVVCISDTHNSQPSIPPGDILIHAGHLTQSGSITELQTTLTWLNSLPHGHKIVVAGNHDVLLDPLYSPSPASAAEREALDWGKITYLCNSPATLTLLNGRDLKVFGSPLSPKHGNWAFQYHRTSSPWSGSNKIPEDTDVLIAHAPLQTQLDATGGRLGCAFLLEEIGRVRPRMHLFGHRHEGYGKEVVGWDGLQRAYEACVIGGGGVWNLMRALFESVKAWWKPAREARGVLVNAAMFGGLRDEEKRKPIIVLL